MSTPYAAFCEDFYINLRLNSQINLPHSRETVLHFFERLQKDFPGMSRFRKADNGDLSLEEDRAENVYRWATLENRRLSCGFVNPTSIEEAIRLHKLILQIAPYHLGISPLEMDYLDVLFGFDIPFSGNHDQIVADCMLNQSPLNCLAEEASATAVDVQPSVTFALSSDCRLQARIDIVTRTNSYQVRTGDYGHDLISVYLVLRRYWGDMPKVTMEDLFEKMVEQADTLCQKHIVSQILRPISEAIASQS